jgi:putative pyruvate formate lyase activating enzyme
MRQAWASAERLAQAQQHYQCCLLCEHRCGVDRRAFHRGPCKATAIPRVFRHRVEYGDEAELVPSHLFYLSGCDLRCVFCINELNAFDPRRGQALTAEFFHRAVDEGLRQGARTLQWVGGEPTIHLPAILEVMAECPRLPPIVWKTDLHATPEALELLDGVVEIYLADFKFGNNSCAQRLAGVSRYVEIVTRNLQIVAGRGKQVGQVRRLSHQASPSSPQVIVRHLLLPGHLHCCFRPIVAWLSEYLPEARLSVRDGYLPHWQAEHYAELNRPLPPFYAEQARAVAEQFGVRLIN